MRERLYKFAPNPVWGNVIALTRDRNGKSLPTDGAPWRNVGTLGFGAEQGPRVGVSWKSAMARIAEDGYLIWPEEGPCGETSEPADDPHAARAG